MRQRSTFVLIVAGFALLDIWCDLMGHSAATSAAAAAVQASFTNARVVWNLALVAFCGLMVALPTKMAAARKMLDIAFPLIAIPFTLLYGFSGGPSAALPLACVVVTAIAYGWLEVRLFCEAAQLPSISHIVAAVVASRVLKAIIAAVIGVLRDGAQIAVDAACVLLCGICLACIARMGGGAVFERQASQKLAEGDRLIIVMLVVVYPALNAVARALSPLGFWGDASITGTASIIPVAAGAAAFALVCFLIFRGCTDASIFNRMAAALVVLLGLLLVANSVILPLITGTSASRGVSMGIELFSHSLFWLAATSS